MAELQTINSSGELTEIRLGGTADGNKLLTSDEIDAKIPIVTGYVPYTGATTNLDLGSNSITVNHVITDLATVDNIHASESPNGTTALALSGRDGSEFIKAYITDNEILEISEYGLDISNYTLTTGARINSITTVNTATYNLLSTDYILNITYTATGAVTITLPTAQVVDGRTIIIKDAGGNAGTNNITVATEGAETIDGAATAVIAADYNSINLYCDGSNWFIY